eukprot:TRINITY_DN34642_c0_g1_i1.p2 TRINITY_DN34642_c0_g1~~TRINITY_DN34642_c0_g1_i1.p2  ORF type:complete len:116 (+),score=27.61 TRINITY_DN34642_c0_g1_i1:184-531(+)
MCIRDRLLAPGGRPLSTRPLFVFCLMMEGQGQSQGRDRGGGQWDRERVSAHEGRKKADVVAMALVNDVESNDNLGDDSDAKRMTVMTVSYTHLRAHETPEHLVCRLLLEKKNERR